MDEADQVVGYQGTGFEQDRVLVAGQDHEFGVRKRVVDLQGRQGTLSEGCELEVVGDGSVGSHYDKVFSIEPALEALAFHPKVFPIVCELTDDQPKLRDGVLIYDDHRLNTPRGGTLHAAGEGDRRSARFEVSDGRVYCDNFVVFFYL